MVPAAGSSTRMGTDKLLIPLRGVPVLAVTLRRLREAGGGGHSEDDAAQRLEGHRGLERQRPEGRKAQWDLHARMQGRHEEE